MYQLVITSVIISFLLFLCFYFGFKTSFTLIQSVNQNESKNLNLPPKNEKLGGVKDKEETQEEKKFMEYYNNIVNYNPIMQGGEKK